MFRTTRTPSTRTARLRTRVLGGVTTIGLVLTLAACGGNTDPLQEEPQAQPTPDAAETKAKTAGVITIGTANFPESEIIGAIWAKVLEDAGYKVTMKERIGSREVYLTALEEGTIDIIPEYSGNLAEYFITKNNGTPLPDSATQQQVVTGLKKNLPAGLFIGAAAPGESKDSFRVTPETAEKYDLANLGDLNKMDKITIAANPEIISRPFGPDGLANTYKIDRDKIHITPISDSGGPLTVKALSDGTVDVANIYTTSPSLDGAGNPVELVTLEDPESLILPQHVLPLMRGKSVPATARELIAEINSHLTTDALVEMNTANVGPSKTDVTTIANKFVADHPVAGGS